MIATHCYMIAGSWIGSAHRLISESQPINAEKATEAQNCGEKKEASAKPARAIVSRA